ncbi:hypothetical protein WN943_029579 [Citrus x changshan-huyou]
MSTSHQKGHSTKQKPDQIIRRPQQSESKHAHKGSHTSQTSDEPKITTPVTKKEITANHSDSGKTLDRRTSRSFERKSEKTEKMHKPYPESSSQSQQIQQPSIQTAPATPNGPNPSKPGSNPVLQGSPHPPRGR